MGQGDELYSGVKKLISDHLASQTETLIVPTFPRAPLVPTMPESIGSNTGLDAAVGLVGSGASTSASAQSMSAVGRGQEGERFLKALKDVWDDHLNCMSKLSDVLRYMVRSLSASSVGRSTFC